MRGRPSAHTTETTLPGGDPQCLSKVLTIKAAVAAVGALSVVGVAAAATDSLPVGGGVHRHAAFNRGVRQDHALRCCRVIGCSAGRHTR
jgi:hypothetical protein